jgi:uroporphyrinogen-III decarboxylase
MNHRERALAAIKGYQVDHIPFIARMDLWYSFHKNQNTLPHPYQKASLWDIQRDLGIGIFGFGAWDISFYRLEHEKVTINKEIDKTETITTYITPYGSLVARDVMAEELNEAAGTGARVEYPFKSAKDYEALQFFIENTRVVENMEAYTQFVDSIGGDGLALPFSGHLPAHQLMIFFMGYQRFYYELNDNPARIEALIQALQAQQEQVLDLAAASPVEAIEVGGNYDEQMTPPPIFERFFSPFYRRARLTLSNAGKLLVIHGDGEMRRLLTSIMECDIQAVEAITPYPMTSIDIASTRRLWKDRVAIWGGLSTVILTEAFSEQQFETYLENLFRDIAPGDRFILGFGDNVPTDASFERVKHIARFWAERGSYPLPIA